ncbi:response regulator [Robertkochia aurantiaca]|uniref:response regulator n=1 Tax=Robertkochia aurantiaca TaxID=2873700 RepID=UPI001CCE97A3|nr:response regulator [Robertkochia sp. 3YJGBD-33]
MDKNATVLLADQDRMLSSLMAYRLRNSGFKVILCRDLNSLKDHLKESSADLIVCNSQLGNTKDFDHLFSLKDSRSQFPQFLIIGERAQQNRITDLMEMGADAYMLKPVTPALLISEIEEMLLAKKVFLGG